MRKMARKTQLQGEKEAPLPKRNPEPWHCVQLCLANANVSDLVHCILNVLPDVRARVLPGRVAFRPLTVKPVEV